MPAASPRGDEAVSEVVGYLFIFGIVMAAISIVYVQALPSLQRSQDQSYLSNVDQSFRVLAFNLNRILTGSAPSQNVELKLKDSTVSILRTGTLNVSWTNASGLNDSTGDDIFATVEHLFRDRRVAYQGGGIWLRSEDGGVATLSNPPFVLGNSTVLPYATLSTGNVSTSGTALVRVEMLVSCRVLGQCAPTISTYANVSRLNMSINSIYCTGWKNYFERTWGFQPSHFTDSDCGDGIINVNVTAWMGGANTTLHLFPESVEGYLT